MAGIHFSAMEKVVLGGMFGMGWVFKLSHPSSLPSIPFGRLDQLISDSNQKRWSITVVNMEHAYVGSNSAIYLYNFEGLVLGRIEAKFGKEKCVGKLSPRSTKCTPLHRSRGICLGEEMYENKY